MKVEFYKHNIGEEEIKKVAQVLNSVFLTTGQVVYEFEERFSHYLGCKYTVGVTSCTAAMHLALLAYDIGPGDEVITTPISFIATANSILHAGAKPVFVDVEPETGNINTELIEAAITPWTKAIMPVHLYGQMCDMKRIKKIAEKYGLRIIEDCAHCIEGERDGIKPGQLSDAACFSFYATKNITCGEGGAISTNNSEIAEKLRRLRLHGMTKGAEERYAGKYQHWNMDILGWKYNMDNIRAALLIGQLNRIEDMWKRREEICKRYEEAFKRINGLDFPKVLPNSKSARHLFTIWVDPEYRDDILRKIQDKGIGVTINFRPIHLMEYYMETFRFRKGMFPKAEEIGKRTITLPLYAKLKDEEVDYVIDSIKEICGKYE